MNKLLIDIQLCEGKIYRLRDLFWLVPLIVLVILFSIFVVWFYWTFPIQLLWLIPAIFIGLLI